MLSGSRGIGAVISSSVGGTSVELLDLEDDEDGDEDDEQLDDSD